MVTREALSSIRANLKLQERKQKDLAEHLGVSEVWVSRILSGKAEMKLYMFLSIAEFLNIPASQLLLQSEQRASETD
ncbi:helix-turn-helix transcriptional regulator [uncultured Rothia sp.]|uniref:helix-turn-helix domain-containing protein n=1 Tax=uncultured Rothia sp. TaxID=316088 RepID=UPI003216D175